MFELQHQIEIDLINSTENNRRILEDLSEQHDKDMQQLEVDLEQKYRKQENDFNQKFMSIVEPSDETTYIQNKIEVYKEKENQQEVVKLQRQYEIQKKRDVQKSLSKNEKVVDSMLQQIKLSHINTYKTEKENKEQEQLYKMEEFRDEMMKQIKVKNVNKATRHQLIKKGLEILNKNLGKGIHRNLESRINNNKYNEHDIESDLLNNGNKSLEKTPKPKTNFIDINKNK